MRRRLVLGLATVAPVLLVTAALATAPDGEAVTAIGRASPSSTAIAGTATTSTVTTFTMVSMSPLPQSVWPTTLRVGLGGVGAIEGTCRSVDGAPVGPVVIWEIGDSVRGVATGITATDWTYAWRAPTAPDIDALQVWCGDPAGWTGGYPATLQVTVEYVAQAAPGDPDADGGEGGGGGEDGEGGDGDDGEGQGGLPILPDSR